MNLRAVVMLLACAGGVVGCGGPVRQGATPDRPPAPVSQVDVVAAEAVPMAVNWDERPGPDGVRIRVTLFQRAQPRPVVGSGTLDFLLFPGKVGDVDPATARPAQSWTFACAELRPSLVRSIVGWGYSLSLGWGDRMPDSPTVTVFVRYAAPGGEPVWSKPVTIAISLQ